MRILLFIALFLAPAALETLTFDLTWDVVDIQSYFVEYNYQGTVTLNVTPLTLDSASICFTWLVPAESPDGVDLNNTWNQTCQFFFNVGANSVFEPVPLTLRAGNNVISAILSGEDEDSTGINDHQVLTMELTYSKCEIAGSTGPDCNFLNDVTEENSVVESDYFQMSTFFMDDEMNFVRSLDFNFAGNITGGFLKYRLNGPVFENVQDGYCEDLERCSIPNPPMTSVTGIFWEIYVDAPNATFSVVPNFCQSGRLGSSCQYSYTLLDTAPGVSTQYSGPRYFILPAPILSVAVAGVDRYTQTDVAPSLLTQVDADPIDIAHALSAGIDAKANRLEANLTSILDVNQSRYVVFVDAGTHDYYGIWIPSDDYTCPKNCSGHGVCNDYVCECVSDYDGIDCSHEIKNFTIEYIILIAVGGLLVLAIVIGVPLYCWMNRHQDYETIE